MDRHGVARLLAGACEGSHRATAMRGSDHSVHRRFVESDRLVPRVDPRRALRHGAFRAGAACRTSSESTSRCRLARAERCRGRAQEGQGWRARPSIAKFHAATCVDAMESVPAEAGLVLGELRVARARGGLVVPRRVEQIDREEVAERLFAEARPTGCRRSTARPCRRTAITDYSERRAWSRGGRGLEVVDETSPRARIYGYLHLLLRERLRAVKLPAVRLNAYLARTGVASRRRRRRADQARPRARQRRDGRAEHVRRRGRRRRPRRQAAPAAARRVRPPPQAGRRRHDRERPARAADRRRSRRARVARRPRRAPRRRHDRRAPAHERRRPRAPARAPALRGGQGLRGRGRGRALGRGAHAGSSRASSSTTARPRRRERAASARHASSSRSTRAASTRSSACSRRSATRSRACTAAATPGSPPRASSQGSGAS